MTPLPMYAGPGHQAAGLSAEKLSMLAGMLADQRQFRTEQLKELSWMSDEPSNTARHEVFEAVIAAAHTARRDIEAAMDRMRRGTYGRCVDCGALLPIERLEILPQLSRCMTCQHRGDAATATGR